VLHNWCLSSHVPLGITCPRYQYRTNTLNRAFRWMRRRSSSGPNYPFCFLIIPVIYIYIYIYIYMIYFNCNWVATRWQLLRTHIHTTIQGTSQNKQYIEHRKYIEQHKN
jgi:hypothetical protein